jgi:hypothetical protein
MGVLGQGRRLVVVDYCRLVTRVLPTQRASGLVAVELPGPLAQEHGDDGVAGEVG